MELRFPLILDGAMGTELQKRGFDGGDCAERWTLEQPEALLKIQRGYVAAGSQILYAPTFGANRVKLEAHGIFNRVTEYNKRLVALSKQAADGKALVDGSLPCRSRQPTARRSSRVTCPRRGCSSTRWVTPALRSWWKCTPSRRRRWRRPGSTSL